MSVQEWDSLQCDRRFLNEFDPTRPTYIKVVKTTWSGVHLNRVHKLEWPKIVDSKLRSRLENALQGILSKCAPSAISKYNLLLKEFFDSVSRIGGFREKDLLDGRSVHKVWSKISSSLRPYFRTLVGTAAQSLDPVRGGMISLEMKTWKANRSLNNGKSVRNWDPAQGSLTSAELEG